MQVVLPPKLLPCKEIRCVFSNSTLATADGDNCYGYLIIVNHFESSIITDSHLTTLQLCGSKPWSSRWNATSNACCSSGKQAYRVTLCPRTFSLLKCTICPLLPQIMCIVFLSKLSYRAAYAKGWVGGGLGEVSVRPASLPVSDHHSVLIFHQPHTISSKLLRVSPMAKIICSPPIPAQNQSTAIPQAQPRGPRQVRRGQLACLALD